MNATRTCTIDGCDHPTDHYARLCTMHYYRIRRHGSPDFPSRQPSATYIWDRIEVTGFCWNWIGPKGAKGYGRVGGARNKGQMAHRLVYTMLVGEIPEGLNLDHLCRNRACVNPDHLEPVTSAENTRRGLTGELGNGLKRRAGTNKKFCIYGHRRTQRGNCLECKLIDTHARRGKHCTVDEPCHAPRLEDAS